MYKLEIKLKQHTPLIHFQHDQDGATLRASEVKPKLDKYIIKHAFHDNFDECKEFLVGYNPQKRDDSIKTLKGKWNSGVRALNYKMKIISSGDLEEYMLASYIKEEYLNELNRNSISAISNTPFFAQEKQNGQIIKNINPLAEWNKIEKKGIIEKKEVTVTILSNTKIVETLSKHIQPYFVATNFGTRQSKGFGCFFPTEIKLNDNSIHLVDIDVIMKQHFKFVYKKSLPNSNLAELLSTINNDYRLIKSGRTRPYAKSKLMLYAESLDPNIGWDKKYIKEYTNDSFETENGDKYVLKCRDDHKKDCYSNKDSYRYFRALLGLAEQFEFLLVNPPLGQSKNKMIVKVKNADIQRYQSPLLFKVFDNTIYLVGNEVAPEMLNKPFDFLVNFQKDSGYKDEPVDESGEPIRTPQDFSLRSFISFAMQDNTKGASLGYITIKS